MFELSFLNTYKKRYTLYNNFIVFNFILLVVSAIIVIIRVSVCVSRNVQFVTSKDSFEFLREGEGACKHFIL